MRTDGNPLLGRSVGTYHEVPPFNVPRVLVIFEGLKIERTEIARVPVPVPLFRVSRLTVSGNTVQYG